MAQEWANARSPNYDTNKDKMYPYSELPDSGQYKLVKIPFCIKNLIEHVDYLGEGERETELGIRGFPDCYNVESEYLLVTEGPDKGRKIPNRIPYSISGNNRTTCNYIKDNSVLTVTVTGNYNLKEYVQDIARIVNSDLGKVIIYGYDVNSCNDYKQIEFLSHEIKNMKQLFYCPIYLLPEHLQQTRFKTSYRAYLSLNELKKELYNNVKKGDYEAAIILTACLTDVYCCNALSDVVNRLLENSVENIMVYAYKLWSNNAKDIVCKYFPTIFKLIFSGDCITIVNKLYNQALKLDLKSKQVLGDNCDKPSADKVSWKIITIWEHNILFFNFFNVDLDMYVKIDAATGYAWGAKDCKEVNYMFFLEPEIINGDVLFTIINCQFLRLKLGAEIESSGDRALIGEKGVVNDKDERFRWIFAAWQQLEGSDKLKPIVHSCSNTI